MTDTVTLLLEKAMGSNSDAERLACLNQAKRLYKNNGVLLPRRVKKQDDLIVPAGMVSEEKFETTVKELTALKDQLFKENQMLSAENTQLRSEKLAAATSKDDAALADVKKKIRQAVVFGAVGWIFGFAALVTLGMMVI